MFRATIQTTKLYMKVADAPAQSIVPIAVSFDWGTQRDQISLLARLRKHRYHQILETLPAPLWGIGVPLQQAAACL